jgi:hypothetical protein
MLKYAVTLITIAFSITATGQTEKTTAPSSPSFGKFGADCSSGRGACAFTISTPESSRPTDTKSAVKVSEKSFTMIIKRSALTSADEIKIAGKPFSQLLIDENLAFVQQETLVIDAVSLANLNLNLSYTKILPDSYPMTVTKDKVEITFTLSL